MIVIIGPRLPSIIQTPKNNEADFSIKEHRGMKLSIKKTTRKRYESTKINLLIPRLWKHDWDNPFKRNVIERENKSGTIFIN